MSLPVTIQNLQCTRGAFRLGPLSLDVAAGARIAIVGPSGSGKTTLLRCLAGLERPDHGTIRIGDALVDDDATHASPAERHLGLVFQDGGLWPHMTALQHLKFAAPGLSKQAAEELLARAGLADQTHQRPAQMSGGEAQRLGLVRALAPNPQVLLLDEPLRSVDVHQRDGLVLLVRTLCDERQVTSILVTHDRDEALALADYLAVMRAGQLVEQGPAIELLQRPRTAFTAAFLRGAACLAANRDGDGRVRTAFGTLAADTGEGDGDLRLVVFPGEVATTDDANAPAGRVLATLPADGDGLRVRVAIEDQIVIARADTAPTGTTAHLCLTGRPRLLPWSLPR